MGEEGEGPVQQFLLSTSVKGVPRILRSPSRPLRAMWLLGVLCFLFMALRESYKLVREYLRYPVLTVVSEEFIHNLDTNYMPDVTVCNLNQVSNIDRGPLDGVPSVEEYHARVQEVTSCSSCTDEEKLDLEHLRKDLLTAEGYYIYIGQKAAAKIGHEMDEFIIECDYLKLVGIRQMAVPCTRYGMITKINSPTYYNCFTITLNESHIKKTNLVVGLTLVLHLGSATDHHKFRIHADRTRDVGALVAIHPAGTFTAFHQNTLSVTPGSHAHISLDISQWEHQPRPYGHCAEGPNGFIDYISNLTKYSSVVCFYTCQEKLVYDTCGCKDYNTYEMFNPVLDSGVPYCESAALNTDALLKNRKCLKQVQMLSSSGCIESCPDKCKQLSYSCSLSRSIWPGDTTDHYFYDLYIANRSFEHLYSRDQFVQSQARKTNQSNIIIDKSIESIRNNFLKVDVGFADYRIVSLREEPKMSLEGLLS